MDYLSVIFVAMKTLAIALIVISLLAAPKVLADERRRSLGIGANISLVGPTNSQEELHESEQAEIHENEPFDDVDEDDDETSLPTPTPLATATPTASPTVSPEATPTETPTVSPTVSPTPTPTETPEVQELEENSSNEHSNGLLGQISDLLKQILNFLESATSKI